MIRKITKKRKSMLFFKKSEVNCNKGSVFFSLMRKKENAEGRNYYQNR